MCIRDRISGLLGIVLDLYVWRRYLDKNFPSVTLYVGLWYLDETMVFRQNYAMLLCNTVLLNWFKHSSAFLWVGVRYSEDETSFKKLAFWRSYEFLSVTGRSVVKSCCPNCLYFWGDFLGEWVNDSICVENLDLAPKMTSTIWCLYVLWYYDILISWY